MKECPVQKIHLRISNLSQVFIVSSVDKGWHIWGINVVLTGFSSCFISSFPSPQFLTVESTNGFFSRLWPVPVVEPSLTGAGSNTSQVYWGGFKWVMLEASLRYWAKWGPGGLCSCIPLCLSFLPPFCSVLDQAFAQNIPLCRTLQKKQIFRSLIISTSLLM